MRPFGMRCARSFRLRAIRSNGYEAMIAREIMTRKPPSRGLGVQGKREDRVQAARPEDDSTRLRFMVRRKGCDRFCVEHRHGRKKKHAVGLRRARRVTKRLRRPDLHARFLANIARGTRLPRIVSLEQ